jgi:hypothetical protein
MTYNNNNAMSGSVTYTNNNIQSGTVTNNNNNNNVSTSTATNTNYNVNSGTQTFNNNNVSTATNVNTNNNVNTGTMTYNNNNVNASTSTANNNNNNVNTSTSSNVNTNNNVQSGTLTNNNNNNSTITQKVIQPPPTAIAPAMMSMGSDLCVTGVSGAAQTQIFGISLGGTQRDANCERLKISKTLFDMGMKVAAVATMCQDRRVFDAMMAAGTPCPYEGKIGEQAKAAWDANPNRVPTIGKEFTETEKTKIE